tara:strand:- start:7 stop:999 length:993 start_codon:yes stop_codon:yes gene_type:complete
MSIVIDVVKANIPINAKSTPSGWIVINCPCCIHFGQARSDRRHRGGFMFTPDEGVIYHCFNCNYKTGWKHPDRFSDKFKKLLTYLGVPRSDIQRLTLETMREADLVVPKKEEIPEYKINWPECKLPPGAKPLDQWEFESSFNRALEYISHRGLLDLADWYYSFAIPGQMQHRIILPYKYKSKIVGFTARWVDKEQHKYPKYYQQQPKDFVFNLDAQTKERKYVLVTEGPFDAVAIDGVAIGGSNINYQQAQIINQLGKEVIFVPDQDKAGIDVVRQATYYNWPVSFPPWDDVKDCADAVNKYGRPFTLKSILAFVETNKTKIKVKSQLWK